MKTPRSRGFEGLLDRQARLWESGRVEHPPEESPSRPNLTISERPYSGGRELGLRVAERLGWDFYDRQIVDALHEDDALGKSVLESLDERLLGFREDWIYHLFVPGHTPTTAYVQRLSQLVFSIGMRGHNAFLGRGAAFILPREWRLSLLVTRTLESRIAAWVTEHDGEHQAARRELARYDRVRADFVARGFHRNADDPASYDVCLNLDAMSVDEAADIVVGALAVRFPHAPLQRTA